MIKSNAILVVILLLAAPTALAQNRIHFNGQYLFLSGANLAWQNFANDIGPNPSTPDTNHFADVFNQIHANETIGYVVEAPPQGRARRDRAWTAR